MAHDCLQKTLLKSDLFGTVEHLHSTEAAAQAGSAEEVVAAGQPQEMVCRDTTKARWWVRPLAIYLASREARALIALNERLPHLAGRRFPRMIQWQGGILLRTWVEGQAMQHAKPTSTLYHQQLLQLTAQVHFQGITHNDLAKEPNVLVLPDGTPALLDLQLGRVARKRTAWFRLLAREDLRHLLKHKRTYCAHALTERELRILATPSWPARLWRNTGKRVYLFITRRILRWSDREGAGDRGGR
ncbi:MAG: serine/threonine protein kinase [Planctomycetes bacterium]|nr:serine/threonine protein kinase [Planctomycetota bacterium]MCP4771742.1 serine/threonine protein kinase [Planctomycetota bacterium]MCP4861015.1 serine/threonine protein kinase [Planctomycetota bacterium]